MSFNPIKFSAKDSQEALARKLNNQLDIIARTMSQGNTTIVISGGTTVSSSSSSSSSNVKSGVQSVTAGSSAYVAFPVSFSTTPYVTFCAISGSDGSFGLVNTSNLTITTSGFTIPAADIIISGTIFYMAATN
jgi:hypothetical protein